MKQIHRQRLFALARQVESQKPLRRKLGGRFYSINFALESWFRVNSQGHICGAAACLAGETILMFGTQAQRDEGLSLDYYPPRAAAKLLGLSHKDYDLLFMPTAKALGDPDDANVRIARMSVTGKQAARVIRHYVKTGKVDWSVRDGAK